MIVEVRIINDGDVDSITLRTYAESEVMQRLMDSANKRNITIEEVIASLLVGRMVSKE